MIDNINTQYMTSSQKINNRGGAMNISLFYHNSLKTTTRLFHNYILKILIFPKSAIFC